jgi:FkbM family methyltransferase
MQGIRKQIQIFQYYSSAMGPWQAFRIAVARLLSIPLISITIKGIKSRVICRTSNSDRFALAQVFIDHDCDIQISPSPQLIIDGGANVGYASVLLANKYPDATILAIEPDTENLRVATDNCRPYPNVHLIRGGIWSSDCSLALQNPDAESWAFRVSEVNPTTPGALRGMSLSTLMEEYGFDAIDLLKLDIEGAEEEVFSHADRSWLQKVNNIVIEVHGESAHRAVREALEEYPFEPSIKGEKLIFTKSNIHAGPSTKRQMETTNVD